ncbi:hypothetical protein C8034_v012000 [Colletotrichum sidae]|uniref:Uncharacterized protein n=1 Tax=Colletotrichum sidae TaxID=1347389 RepID=A0A4V3I3G0_9PEZI|nr:hypothetical protein C8034_v012000 [Colletotrichum sidae]
MDHPVSQLSDTSGFQSDSAKGPPISSPPSDDVLSQDFHRQVVTKLMRNESYTHNNHEGKKVLPAVDAASIAQALSPLARPQPTPRA